MAGKNSRSSKTAHVLNLLSGGTPEVKPDGAADWPVSVPADNSEIPEEKAAAPCPWPPVSSWTDREDTPDLNCASALGWDSS